MKKKLLRTTPVLIKEDLLNSQVTGSLKKMPADQDVVKLAHKNRITDQDFCLIFLTGYSEFIPPCTMWENFIE